MPRSRTKGRGGFVIAGLGFGVAAGVALGALVVGPSLSSESSAQSQAAPEEEGEASRSEEIAAGQLSVANSFIDQVGPGVVDGTLADRPVLILRTADVEPAGVDSLTPLLENAASINAGTIELTPKFFSPAGADELKTIAAATLPAGAELSPESPTAGTHAGQLLSAALLLNPENGEPLASTEDRALVLQSLRDAEFIDYPDGTILPAQAVVFATGAGTDGLVIDNQLDFVNALKDSGAATVATGTLEAAEDEAFLGRLRAEDSSVSSVDSLGQAWAPVSTVLALAEQIAGEDGDYGAAAEVDATTPALP